VVRIREYYRDANAPRAHDVLPAAFAAVRNSAGELLLVRRIDDGNWELPGGRIEVGESVSEAVVREVAEESGITIALIGFVGVYSDPSHVRVDPFTSRWRCVFTPLLQRPTRAANHVRTASRRMRQPGTSMPT
jgi:8-oxo-dGTP pyrophosphatase MutT (NUDIX family)